MKQKSHNLKIDNIKNLIFDLDGTLIDSSKGVVKATNYALNRINEPIRSDEEITEFIGYPLEEMFLSFSDKSYREFREFFQEKAKEAVVAETEPLDGVEQVLRQLLDRGYRMAIGTTKISIHIEKILAKFRWEDIFVAYIGSDNVSRVKPDPEIFIKALNLLNSNKENTLVIGDTVNDIYAARGASLPSIGIRSPYNSRDKLETSNPDIIIDNINELLTILE